MPPKKDKPAKTKPAKQKFKIKRFEERVLPCKHVFSQVEKIELGSQMTAQMQTFTEVENQMKSIAAEYKAKMKTIAAGVDLMANKFRDGYEMREVKCIVYFNTATSPTGKAVKKQGMKRIVNAATKEHVCDEPMSQSDLQTEMFETEKLKRQEKEAKEAAKRDPSLPLNSPEVPPAPGQTASTAATS